MCTSNMYAGTSPLCLIFKHSQTQTNALQQHIVHALKLNSYGTLYLTSCHLVMCTLFLQLTPSSPTSQLHSKMCDIWLFVRFAFTLFISLVVAGGGSSVFAWAFFLFSSIHLQYLCDLHLATPFSLDYALKFFHFLHTFSLARSPFCFYHVILWMCQSYCENEYNVQYKCGTMMMIIIMC